MNKKQNSLKQRVARFTDRFSLGNTVTSMALSFLPQFTEKLTGMDKPVAEGGLLKEGEDKMAFILTQQNGKMMVTVSSLSFNTETGQMMINKPISNQSLETLLQQQNDDEHEED
ncbi:hypothetical protein [Flavilitoribacter nigricans]|uniref:Uncharacterized protein n=1 Tax=Flavilitoribacter nigricans (strain ATCC 23147 / DSM 23189 / NBRC 102662 / NCIMB 1420 / SS-2) TaxID=1122177 RepID=A0A2D0MWW8_FLAN2|nr:hypothetical protein [Flavilitoribacter nigricans]PHN00754.1 hypothetical protein CRP01_40555 [Flavilitoribacter nigricans DSM 23189 = NBRC 102662]